MTPTTKLVRELKDESGYDDWTNAFAAAGLDDADLGAEVLYDSDDSPEGYGSANMYLVFKRPDGSVGALFAWCDTTGWDCQSGGDTKDFGAGEDAYELARKWLREEHHDAG